MSFFIESGSPRLLGIRFFKYFITIQAAEHRIEVVAKAEAPALFTNTGRIILVG
jgi:hypothetical protein